MKLDASLRKLARARKRLAAGQGRVARRNARRAMLGALVSVRHALDAEFPTIEKPKPPPEPKPAKPPKREPLKLPFKARWDKDDVRLFLEVASDVCGMPAFDVGYSTSARDISRRWWQISGGGSTMIFVNLEWGPSKKWLNVIAKMASKAALARFGPSDPAGVANRLECEDVLLDLWAQFHTKPLPLSDLELAARHQEFLERRGKRC